MFAPFSPGACFRASLCNCDLGSFCLNLFLFLFLFFFVFINRAKKDQDANLAVAHTWSEFNSMLDKQKVCVWADLEGAEGAAPPPPPPFLDFSIEVL